MRVHSLLSYQTRFSHPPTPPREKQLDAVVPTRGDSCRCRGRESGRRRDAAVLGRRLINHQAVHVLDARRCSVVSILHGGGRAALCLQVSPSPRGKICLAVFPLQPAYPSRMYALWTGAWWPEKYLYFYSLSRHKFNFCRGGWHSSTRQCRAAKGWSVGF